MPLQENRIVIEMMWITDRGWGGGNNMRDLFIYILFYEVRVLQTNNNTIHIVSDYEEHGLF